MLLDITPKMLKSRVKGLRIIGIHGPAGVGKDSLAMAIMELYGISATQIKPFAGPLKHSVESKYGLEESYVWGDSKEVIHPFWGISSRKIQQFEGTENTRETVHPNFWLARWIGEVDGALASYHMPVTENTIVIIPDLRFQNEYDMVVQNNGMVVDMSSSPSHRPIINGIVGHKSENKLNLYAKDQTYEVINNGSIDSLNEKAEWILEQSVKHRVS